MHKTGSILLLLSLCSAAFAQLDSNSITVSASNSTTLQPDQVLFSIAVSSSLNTGLEDVLAALQPAGITMANFSSVSTVGQITSVLNGSGGGLPPTAMPTLGWTFTLPVPFANSKATVATLTTLQQNIAKANNGLSLSFSIVGTQISQQLAQSQTCSFSSLITSATTQAQSLAAAGSFTLGPIIALSSSTANGATTSGYFSSGPYVAVLSNAVPPPCAITAKFSVTRN